MTVDVAAARREAAAAIAEHLRITAEQVLACGSLLTLPGFDSVAVVTVLERLEEAFRVEIAPELILPEAFESLDTLAALVAAPAGPAVPQAPTTTAAAGGHR